MPSPFVQPQNASDTVVPAPRQTGLSLDLWAVILSLALALLVRLGLLPSVPW